MYVCIINSSTIINKMCRHISQKYTTLLLLILYYFVSTIGPLPIRNSNWPWQIILILDIILDLMINYPNCRWYCVYIAEQVTSHVFLLKKLTHLLYILEGWKVNQCLANINLWVNDSFKNLHCSRSPIKSELFLQRHFNSTC